MAKFESTLNDKHKQKAEEELGETDENRDEKLQLLRENSQVTCEYGGRSGRTDFPFLIRFLRARKFNVDKAADLYKAYHEKRQALYGFDKLTKKESFTDEIEKLAKEWGEFIAVLDQVDTLGRRVIICKESVFKVNKSADENRGSTLWFFLLLEWLLETHEEMQVNGVVVISDLGGFGLSHFQWLCTHPAALKERITSIQDGVPMRIKMIRVANEPFIFSMVYALVSPFLKAKLRQRLKTVSNRYEEIYKILDGNNGNDENWKSLLPKNIGGKKSWSGMTAATTQKVLDHYKQYSSI